MPTKKHSSNPQCLPSSKAVAAISKRPERKTKQALLLEMIEREAGATLGELTSATGWLPHTVRAAITGLRKRNHDVQCQRIDGDSRYTLRSGGQ